MEIGGSLHSITLSDVLYAPDWNVDCLFSRRTIDILFHFQMVGADGIMTVPYKCDHSRVFIAELMHVCYQVLPLAHHNKIYAAATEFRHQAL